MRIGIIIDDFFPASGGIGRSVQTQLEELAARGHDVTLIAPDRHLARPGFGRVIECPTHYLEGLPAHLSVLHFGSRSARRISAMGTYDVIHSQTERGALILAARIARLQGAAHVHSFHANLAGTHQTARVAVVSTLLYRGLINPLLSIASGRRPPGAALPSARDEPGGWAARIDWASLADIAGKVDAFTVPSAFMLGLIGQAARRKLPGSVVPTGYNRRMRSALESLSRSRSDQRVRFLSVGRLSKEKRLDVLIRAFRQAQLADAELVIVGDGDQRDVLRGLARGADNIIFRGHQSSVQAIAAELRDADVLVLSSYRFDSQGLVVTEAVAAGLPVLYCDDRLSAGLSRDSAHLVGPTASGLADGMRELMDPQLRYRLAEGTRKLVAELDPERTAEGYERVYEEAIMRRGSTNG
ncbi:MAG: glycosyltransferase family 4 protein [Arachnia sp.]